jgi:Toprim-like
MHTSVADLLEFTWGSDSVGLDSSGRVITHFQGSSRRREHDGKCRRWLGFAERPWRWSGVMDATRTIILTESESDAVVLICAGLESETVSVVASPGVMMPSRFFPLFSGLNVVLAFDSDLPGSNGAGRAVDNLIPYAVSISQLSPPLGFKDFGDSFDSLGADETAREIQAAWKLLEIGLKSN